MNELAYRPFDLLQGYIGEFPARCHPRPQGYPVFLNVMSRAVQVTFTCHVATIFPLTKGIGGSGGMNELAYRPFDLLQGYIGEFPARCHPRPQGYPVFLNVMSRAVQVTFTCHVATIFPLTKGIGGSGDEDGALPSVRT